MDPCFVCSRLTLATLVFGIRLSQHLVPVCHAALKAGALFDTCLVCNVRLIRGSAHVNMPLNLKPHLYAEVLQAAPKKAPAVKA